MEPKVIDLADLDDQIKQEATVEIIHPKTGLGTGIKITVTSPDSERYQKLLRKGQNRTIAAMSKGSGKAATAEMIADNSFEVLVGSVVRWEDVNWGGTPLPCTPENVSMLFTKLPFIKQQVDEFIGERANFFRD